MKITTFNPLIITRDPESAIKVFEDLGFKRRHVKENISEINTTNVRMKNEKVAIAVSHMLFLSPKKTPGENKDSFSL